MKQSYLVNKIIPTKSWNKYEVNAEKSHFVKFQLEKIGQILCTWVLTREIMSISKNSISLDFLQLSKLKSNFKHFFISINLLKNAQFIHNIDIYTVILFT